MDPTDSPLMGDQTLDPNNDMDTANLNELQRVFGEATVSVLQHRRQVHTNGSPVSHVSEPPCLTSDPSNLQQLPPSTSVPNSTQLDP